MENLFEIDKKGFYTYLHEQPLFSGYSYEDTDIVDEHPTITMHNQYLKRTCPEFSISNEYAEELESKLVLTSQEDNRKVQEFNKLRGKRIGSLISKQMSNDNMFNFKYSS